MQLSCCTANPKVLKKFGESCRQKLVKMETRWVRFLGFPRLFLQKEHLSAGAVNSTGKNVRISKSATLLPRWLKRSGNGKQQTAMSWPRLFIQFTKTSSRLRTEENITVSTSPLSERKMSVKVHHPFIKMTLKNKYIQFDIPSSYLYVVVLKKLPL